MYWDKDLMEDKLYQLIYQFNESETINRDLHFALLDNMYPSYDGNGKTCIICW